jgi:hypothetical protein
MDGLGGGRLRKSVGRATLLTALLVGSSFCTETSSATVTQSDQTTAASRDGDPRLQISLNHCINSGRLRGGNRQPHQ